MVQVYTNNGMLEIQLTKANSGKLFIYDPTGKQIFGQLINLSGIHFCAPSSGVLLFRFVSDKGEVQTGKILMK